MYTLYKREMNSYLISPVFYAILGLFMLLIAVFFSMGNLNSSYGEFGPILQTAEYLMIIFAPILTMKLLAEEKKNKTDVLLLTSPTPISKMIIGKFLAAVTSFIIMVASTIIFPIILAFFMAKEAVFPWSSLISNYLGFILLGMLFISVGLLASSLSDSQVLSAVIGIVSLFVLFFIGQIGAGMGGLIGKVTTWISPISRYESSFAAGLLNIPDIVFYLTFTAIFVFITIVNTERKRWSQG